MASGLLALLDDVAMIARLAAASLDDVAAASGKAASKAAGVVIDDTAVTPRYVIGFSPERELPIIWRIAKGSLRNKLVILLPLFLLLAAFLPQALVPLLMAGGAFLAFEAAEKLLERLGLHAAGHGADIPVLLAPEARESQMVRGAIRTDLILSAEILMIALGQMEDLSFAARAAALVVVSLVVTAGVYGAVALIVKMDDAGLSLAQRGSAAARALGRALVAGMPRLLAFLSGLGTFAMAWVGGGILLHGMEDLGLAAWLPQAVHRAAEAAGHAAPVGGPAITWLVGALLAASAGLAVGMCVAAASLLAQRLRGPARQA